MANQRNGHCLFADESWQTMFSNINTGRMDEELESYRSMDEELESFRRTHGGASHTEKTKWAAEEQLKLIVGVASSTTPKTGRKNWKYMAENYFKDSKRRENNKLKQKWKELKKHAENKKDDSQKEFYMMVAIVEAETQRKPEEKIKFDNVIKEWSGALKKQDQVIMARAQQQLTSVKKMEPQQQLQKIRDWVTEAEQCHAYGNIPYWELSSGILDEPGTAA